MSKKSNEFKLKALLILILLAYLFAIPVAYYCLYALPKYNDKKLEFERQRVEQDRADVKESRRLLEEKTEKKRTQLNSCLTIAETSLSSDLWAKECETWKLQVDQIKSPEIAYKLDENGRCLLPTNLASNVWKKVKEVKDACRKNFELSCQ